MQYMIMFYKGEFQYFAGADKNQANDNLRANDTLYICIILAAKGM